MAHIVPFRATAARRADEAESCTTDGAQIVIFPGVRRERHAEAADLPGSGEHLQRDAERDWLELREELPTACP